MGDAPSSILGPVLRCSLETRNYLDRKRLGRKYGGYFLAVYKIGATSILVTLLTVGGGRMGYDIESEVLVVLGTWNCRVGDASSY